MAIENLRVIGDVLYERRSDGQLYPVRRVAGQQSAQSAPQADQGSMTGFPELDSFITSLGHSNQMFNPVEGVGQSMAASQRMMDPNTGGWDRVGALGDMLSGVAGVVAPAGVASRAGAPASVALMEGLLGGSPTTAAVGDTVRSAGRKIAERANQPGPMPTTYSNPIPGLLGDAARTDPAIARGDEILGLLKSGRASEVTDQMLDMGDPVLNARLSQHLYQNYDLPMDAASREGRARDMGFSPTFHGTGAEISAVNPDYFGNGADLLGSGFYTSTNPDRVDRYVPRKKTSSIEYSKEYAEGGNALPLMVREPQAFNLGDQLGSAAEDIAAAYQSDPFFTVNRMSSGAVHLSDFDGNGILLDPDRHRHWALQGMRKAFGPTEVSNTLSDLGYSGVTGAESGGHSVRVSYNPEDLRSRFARFDPRLSHLKNLSASLGGLGLLGYMQESDRR